MPTLVVEDNAILDSHAAAIYLCQQVSSQVLYPKENILLMARVNEMMFFNCSILFKLDSEILVSIIIKYYSINDKRNLNIF